MPTTIYIPRDYQARVHLLPPPYTTTAACIHINSTSPLGRAIAADAALWRWNTDTLSMSEWKETWKKEYGEWADWRRIAKRKGWFTDLFRIWEREHGVRIRERYSAAGTTGGGERSGSEGSGRHALVVRVLEWLRARGRGEGGRRLRGRIVDERTQEVPERLGSGDGDELKVMSLSESLIERLVEWDEKGTFEDQFGEDEETVVEGEFEGHDEIPFADESEAPRVLEEESGR